MALKKNSEKKSIFLFGPRQTGKSFLLRTLFPKSLSFNLLLSHEFLRYSQEPHLIREEILSQIKSKVLPAGPIIIDEIQKIPLLLDEVHFMIEEYHLNFILTGSSARKLKTSGVNLLAGRALVNYLFPLTYPEIGHDNFDLLKILNRGTLPAIFNLDEPDAHETLMSYVGTYLKEEIIQEALIRKIENFTRFLHSSAHSNGEILNFTKIASDAQVPSRTIIEYYKILEDTLVGHLLPPFKKGKMRKAVSTSKFYFFDLGVTSILCERRLKDIKLKTTQFGVALEHFIFLELKAYLSYNKIYDTLTFWRSLSGYEVDFLIGEHTAIEVKGTHKVQEQDFKGLMILTEELPHALKRLIIVSCEAKTRITEINFKDSKKEIEIYPVEKFLIELWKGAFF
jgi:predicted AAA+ superfamily ATPase